MRTKRFDNEEWRKHNKLAILTFQLAQIEFHLNTWKSITTCRLDPTRNDSRQQGWTPKSLDCKKRPKPLPVEKPKMFDDTEWKLHRRLADIAFKLVQLDFHDLMPVLRSVDAYFDVLKPPMMDEAFKNSMEQVRQQLIVDSNEIMLDHKAQCIGDRTSQLHTFMFH